MSGPGGAVASRLPLAVSVGLALAFASACGGRAHREPEAPGGGSVVRVLHGKATFYSSSLEGGPTASGERYRGSRMTAAHRSLPLGTWVRVTNLANDRSVVVRINDRGPYGRDRSRIIDLSRAAARKLHMIGAGVARVKVEVLARPRQRHRQAGTR